MCRRSAARVAATVAVASAAWPAAASAAVDFRTPNRAAYCDYYPVGEVIEGGPNTHPFFQCWTPNDGFFTTMSGRSRVSKGYSQDQLVRYTPATARILRFGQTFRRGSFVCKSRATGLTCTNAKGHGWWLGRFVGYRIY
jgi:hypothetical protein